jgi:hypothetical protein
MKFQLVIPALILVAACTNSLEINNDLTESEISIDIPEQKESPHAHFPESYLHGKFIDTLGTTLLYGGKDFSNHFDLKDCSLKQKQFHFGRGRESFPALLKPNFIGINDIHDTLYNDSTRFLFLEKDGIKKAYSIPDLTRCEIVNDEINGEPIMAAYCILADLGAIYTRTYKEVPFTFALSGYTYHDDKVWNGLDGFVLWDRETESLWWPLTGYAVSGAMNGTKLIEYDKTTWEELLWKDIKLNHLDALILESNQDFDRPTIWPKYSSADLK